MKDRKSIYQKIGNKLLFPSVGIMLLLAIGCGICLGVIFVNGWDNTPMAYAVYVLSFYTLSVITLACIFVFPSYYRAAKTKIEAHEYGYRFLNDAAFRMHVFLNLSFIANLLYAALNVFYVFWAQSAWFAILAGYYIILATMRFLLVRYVENIGIGKNLAGELRRSRLCAMILMTVNLVLSGSVLMILYQDRGYEYPGVLIYVMAAYTFYVTVHSVIDLVRYRKYKSPVMSTAKVINLSAALVSMLALETAMLTQFGKDSSPEFRRIMISATGAGVSIVVVTLSVFMILRANLEIKKMKINN